MTGIQSSYSDLTVVRHGYHGHRGEQFMAYAISRAIRSLVYASFIDVTSLTYLGVAPTTQEF